MIDKFKLRAYNYMSLCLYSLLAITTSCITKLAQKENRKNETNAHISFYLLWGSCLKQISSLAVLWWEFQDLKL